MKTINFLFLFVFLTSQQVFNQIVYWQQIAGFSAADIKATSNGDLFASVSNGIQRSYDNGDTWNLYYNAVNYSKLAVDSNDNIYAGTTYGEGIWKSTDYGSTFTLCYNSQSGITALYITVEGFIYAGNEYGGFYRSFDNGLTWEALSITNKKITSITTVSDGRIFISTEGNSILMSTDQGDTWTQIVNSNLYNSINSLITDSNDYIYADHRMEVSISTDQGDTWTLSGYFSSFASSTPVFGIDSSDNIYYVFSGVYKTTNQGVSWNSMGGPGYIYSILNFSDRIYLSCTYGILRYDPNVTVYVGNNYLPLKIGNKWQFINSFCGNEDDCEYSLGTIQITKDTLINNEIYFLYNTDWVRYSEADKRIYLWWNDSDNVYLDCGLIPNEAFYQLTIGSHQYRQVTMNNGTYNLFNQNFNYKGYRFNGYIYPANILENRNFAENLGPVFYSEIDIVSPGPDFSKQSTLIMAILYDSTGNQIDFTNHHKPEISLNPLTSINSKNFHLSFQVDHYYTILPQGFSTGLDFIDSVYMESFYKNEDTVLNNNNINASHYSSNLDYTINTIVDTLKLKNGYSFYYKITAKDKGIIPERSYSPDSGYYRCDWDFGTFVKNIQLVPSEYSLSQNYPNPFNPTTTIRYSVPVVNANFAFTTKITLKVYNVLGREVATLVNGYKPAGNYESEFNGNDLPSGIYFYSLEAESFIQVKKMILLK